MFFFDEQWVDIKDYYGWCFAKNGRVLRPYLRVITLYLSQYVMRSMPPSDRAVRAFGEFCEMEMTRVQKYRSLSQQLVYALIGFCVAVTAISSGIQFASDWKREKDGFEQDISKVGTVSAHSVAEHFWSQNTIGIESQLFALMLHSEIYATHIYDDRKRPIAWKVRDVAPPRHIIVRDFPIVLDGSGEIGTLEIKFTTDEMIKKLFVRLMTLVLLNAFLTCLIATLVYYFVQKRIGIPLRSLAGYFRENQHATMESLASTAFRRRAPFSDEISELIDHVSGRELQLSMLLRSQENKIETQAARLSEVEDAIAQEKARAELSARMAQLGEMATGIAHEINNPLTIISGNMFKLRRKKDGSMPTEADIQDVTQAIERMVLRISSIIRGFKTYARDGSGDPFVTANPGVVIRDMTTLVVGRLIAKNIDLIVKDETSSSSTFECREVQISQVLVILANNALDAVKELPNPWIEIRATEGPDSIEFRVTDSGGGIPMNVQEKMFRPFFTTKGAGEGTGLGLSIAIQIIKSHNGQIYIDNNCKNTCFVIRLPKVQPSNSVKSA